MFGTTIRVWAMLEALLTNRALKLPIGEIRFPRPPEFCITPLVSSGGGVKISFLRESSPIVIYDGPGWLDARFRVDAITINQDGTLLNMILVGGPDPCIKLDWRP